MKHIILFLCALLAPLAAQDTVSVPITWDYPNPTPDHAGFRVYQGTTNLVLNGVLNPSFVQKVDTGKANVVTLTVPRGAYAFVAVTAYNTNGDESAPAPWCWFAIGEGEVNIPPPPQDVRKAARQARVEKSTDLRNWVPIYFTTSPVEFYRVVYTL